MNAREIKSEDERTTGRATEIDLGNERHIRVTGRKTQANEEIKTGTQGESKTGRDSDRGRRTDS